MIKLILLLLIASSINADYVVGTSSDYKCISEYVYEGDGSKNQYVPKLFEKPILSLTNNRPELAILRMKDNSKMYLNAKEYINIIGYGKGISYQNDKNFLDVFSSGDVIFGVKNNGNYHSTIKIFCSNIKNIKYLKN